MVEKRDKEAERHQVVVGQQQQPLVWYCPSRWLLAHHDSGANINTMSSHMCLADMNNDGENLMALIDFKQRLASDANGTNSGHDLELMTKSPYECRMRVYRGQQLIYNHFLDDVPSGLIVTSVILPAVNRMATRRIRMGTIEVGERDQQKQQPRPLLTITINDDVYFYHKLRPSHKLSLEDEECILDSLNKSEVDAWRMVQQNKVDTGTMSELLASLSQELGNHELTSHSQNFIALKRDDQRKQYLVAWKLKQLQQQGPSLINQLDFFGEQIMSMDTICCSAARLRFDSSITRSGDFGQTRDQNAASLLDGANFSARWNRILDVQKDGLLVGTEDRHLLIYEMRAIRSRLECHYRLKATPDHILVERRSPASFDTKQDLRTLTYKILVSCRNCRIYSIEQLYLVGDQRASPCELTELVALKSNVLEMSWTGLDETDSNDPSKGKPSSRPCFVVACLDRRVYCFGSQTGHCKWIIDFELPITCLTCLPKLEVGTEEASLVGVATQANRVDFYVASNGRIVDSIYFSQDEYPQAMVFGRFGREDNCLCLVTNSGCLVVLILKRTAKFAHGQCLSSAASYASQTLASCRQIIRESSPTGDINTRLEQPQPLANDTMESQQHGLRLSDGVDLPSAFALSKSSKNTTDQMIDSILNSNHHCDQSSLKSALDVHSTRPRLQIPVKGREFVAQILDQSRESRQTSQMFASHMIRLREKVRASLEQQEFGSGKVPLSASSSTTGTSSQSDGSRLMLTRVLGLGNIYRITLALRLNVEMFIERYHELLLTTCDGDMEASWVLRCLLRPRTSNLSKRQCQVSPFKVEIACERDEKAKFLVRPTCEANLGAKLTVLGPVVEPVEGEFVPLDVQVFAYHKTQRSATVIQRPFLITSINIPLMCN